MSVNRSTILGLFFLVTLSVLAYYTLFLTDFSLFKAQTRLQVHFEQTNGLREGDSVLVAGMRWGRVKQLTFDPDAPLSERITVTAVLNEPLPLHEGFKIQIRDATLLGGRNLSIDPGPADAPIVPADTVLYGTVAPNPIEGLTRLVDTSGPRVEEIVENVSVWSRDLREGKGVLGRLTQDPGMADDLAAALSSASASLAYVEEIAADLRAGRGSAGQLLVNDSLYEDVSTFSRKSVELVDEATGLVSDVRRGTGLAGRIVQDETLARDVSQFVAATRSIAEKIDRGEGTIGVLVNDDAIVRDIEAAARTLANGEGTIGALMTNPAVFENIRQVTEDLAVFSGALRSGQGSIGRLVMDDDLYQDLKTAIRIVQRSLEEFREAAPITTFTTVFFGAF